MRPETPHHEQAGVLPSQSAKALLATSLAKTVSPRKSGRARHSAQLPWSEAAFQLTERRTLASIIAESFTPVSSFWRRSGFHISSYRVPQSAFLTLKHAGLGTIGLCRWQLIDMGPTISNASMGGWLARRSRDGTPTQQPLTDFSSRSQGWGLRRFFLPSLAPYHYQENHQRQPPHLDTAPGESREEIVMYL